MSEVDELPSISIVMPTHDRAGALRRVLRPLLDDPVACDIVVVVDGSRDGSIELLEGMSSDHERLRPILIPNSGEMIARETGARVASGEVVLFLDDDVVARPGLVEGHARHHARGRSMLVLGYMPIELPPERGPEDFATFLYEREYESNCASYERDPTRVLSSLWAGNFSMRASDCIRVGMPAPALRRYHADREFGIRCLKAGIRGVFDRSLRATHLHTRTLEAFMRDARNRGEGQVIIERLHPDVVPPSGPEAFGDGLPPSARAVYLAARRPRVAAAAERAFPAVIRGAGAAHLWPVQDAAAKLIRRIEHRRGALSVATAAADGGAG